MSRFFKEFSDFENELTLKFRHPPVISEKELIEIGL
jgi:hypothetical protein